MDSVQSNSVSRSSQVYHAQQTQNTAQNEKSNNTSQQASFDTKDNVSLSQASKFTGSSSVSMYGVFVPRDGDDPKKPDMPVMKYGAFVPHDPDKPELPVMKYGVFVPHDPDKPELPVMKYGAFPHLPGDGQEPPVQAMYGIFIPKPELEPKPELPVMKYGAFPHLPGDGQEPPIQAMYGAFFPHPGIVEGQEPPIQAMYGAFFPHPGIVEGQEPPIQAMYGAFFPHHPSIEEIEKPPVQSMYGAFFPHPGGIGGVVGGAVGGILGGIGQDKIDGGAGDDKIKLPGKIDGGAGSDKIKLPGIAGGVVGGAVGGILGGIGQDKIDGGAGSDKIKLPDIAGGVVGGAIGGILGGIGQDKIDGGAGDDKIKLPGDQPKFPGGLDFPGSGIPGGQVIPVMPVVALRPGHEGRIDIGGGSGKDDIPDDQPKFPGGMNLPGHHGPVISLLPIVPLRHEGPLYGDDSKDTPNEKSGSSKETGSTEGKWERWKLDSSKIYHLDPLPEGSENSNKEVPVDKVPDYTKMFDEYVRNGDKIDGGKGEDKLP